MRNKKNAVVEQYLKKHFFHVRVKSKKSELGKKSREGFKTQPD